MGTQDNQTWDRLDRQRKEGDRYEDEAELALEAALLAFEEVEAAALFRKIYNGVVERPGRLDSVEG